jgi:hypothetical protein
MLTDKIVEQILAVRATAATNMFDAKAVFELADFIFTDTKAYSTFILTGKRGDEDA